MINGRRYTATLPTEADARLWEIEMRAAVAVRRRAERVTFAEYAAKWLATFLDDAPDRARLEAAPNTGSCLCSERSHCSRYWTQTDTNWSGHSWTPVGAGMTTPHGSALL